MNKLKRVVIVGSGNIAEALASAFAQTENYRIAQIFARNPERGTALARLAGCPWENDPARIAASDVYLLAVSDKAIREVSETLDFGDALAAHTSGSAPLTELSAAAKRRGVFYPLQTFTAGQAVDFRKIPIFIEAEHEADEAELITLGLALTDTVRLSDTELRRNLHIAAVFVCNMVNHLYAVGEKWMEVHGLDFDLLKPLMEETTRKMLESPSPFAVQTGPAVREDFPTLAQHLEMLRNYPDLKNIYALLSTHIITLKNNHGKL